MNRGLSFPLKDILQRLYRIYGVRGSVRIGRSFHMGLGSIIEAPRNLEIGDHVYIGKYCTIECDGVIGDGVLIANHVGLIGRADHDYRCLGRFISQAPRIGDPDYAGAGGRMSIIIEDDVWIGYGAVVLTGVKIARGAMVAANSLVTRNVPPYAIVGGNPAQRLGARFSPEEIIEHESRLRERHLRRM